MPTRASKLKDIEETNSAALGIVALTTGQKPEPIAQEKNAAAVALAMLGASKGGHARAAALSARKRSQIAKKAAKKRWKKE